jgi:PAS domain S-box-containing protein
MTERRQQEAALKRSEARYRDVVESQSSFVCRMLPDATLTFVNTAYCRFLRRERLELLGQNYLELVSPTARDAARRALARALDEPGHVSWECEVVNPDGSRGWQSWVCHTIDGTPDEVRELQLIGADVTDRKRAEESGRQLAHATRFAAVGELTAMVAHEINQPLCAILSNAEAAESSCAPISRRSKSCATSWPTSARTTCVPIRPSAAFARCCSDANSNRGAWISWKPSITSSSSSRAMRCIGACRCAARCPPTTAVIGDRSYLEQVLVILMVNGMDSMKSTAEDVRELVVSARPVDGSLVESR